MTLLFRAFVGSRYRDFLDDDDGLFLVRLGLLLGGLLWWLVLHETSLPRFRGDGSKPGCEHPGWLTAGVTSRRHSAIDPGLCHLATRVVPPSGAVVLSGRRLQSDSAAAVCYSLGLR